MLALVMARGWGSKHAFKRMRGDLGAMSDRVFERGALS